MKILDFNAFKMRQVITAVAEKYHESAEYFDPLVSQLVKMRPHITAAEVEDELTSFMQVIRIKN